MPHTRTHRQLRIRNGLAAGLARGTRAMAIAPLAVCVALLAATTAGAAPLELSGPTPFPSGCGVPGTPASNSNAEPSIARDPRDPQHIVAAWQQDRFNADGGALSNVVGVSRDGGRSFQEVLVRGLSRCTGGPDERTSDPWVSIGPDGIVYLASLTFSEMPQNNAIAGPTTLVSSRSDDGGLTWQAPVTVQPFDQTYNDRESLTADPARPGTAYYVFVKRYGAAGESGFEEFSRTIDGGRTWSAPTPIYTPPPGTLTDPVLIQALPDGTLVNLLIVANLTPFLPSPAPKVNWQIVSQRSTDGGKSWGGAVNVASISPFAPLDSASSKIVRAYPVISAAVGAAGAAYVAWNEIPSPTGGSRVLFAKSSDGARTWSTPGIVKDSPGQAFLPSMAVAPDGTLGVSYDDTRNQQPGSQQLTTDVWLSQSIDGGASWKESHLAGSFDTLTAPESDSSGVQGLFLGDYQGLVALDGSFGAIFAQAKPQSTHGPSDMFFAGAPQVRAPPAAAHAPAGALPPARPGGGRGGRPAIRLTVRPRSARVGRRTRFTFRATTLEAGVRRRLSGARVLFGGRHARTDRRGRARLVLAPRRAGSFRAVALRSGYKPGRARVRIRRKHASRRPLTRRSARGRATTVGR